LSLKSICIASSLVVVLGLAACSQIGGGKEETYQRMLGQLCSAPPGIMGSVVNTPELSKAWMAICAHINEVPATPVAQTRIAQPKG
jgi:hypothetical protein